MHAPMTAAEQSRNLPAPFVFGSTPLESALVAGQLRRSLPGLGASLFHSRGPGLESSPQCGAFPPFAFLFHSRGSGLESSPQCGSLPALPPSCSTREALASRSVFVAGQFGLPAPLARGSARRQQGLPRAGNALAGSGEGAAGGGVMACSPNQAGQLGISNKPAAPMPPPMHMETMPKRPPRRRSS